MMSRSALGLLVCVSTAAAAKPDLVDRSAPTPVTAISAKDLETLSGNHSLDSVLKSLACPAQTVPSLSSRPAAENSAGQGLSCVRPDDLRMIDIYHEHNRARALYGSQPLVWDPELARGAADYARQLTGIGDVIHSSREGRKTIRENLLQSLRGGRSPKEMVGVWTAEKRYFIPGAFPNVSTTGNWADVGHYTQLVWPTTTRLGCAIASDIKFDWTVCRYSPPGNRDGTMVAERVAPPPPPKGGKEKALHDTPMAQPRDIPAPLPPSGPQKAVHDTPMAQPYALPTAQSASNIKQIQCKTGFLPSPIGTYTYRVRVTPPRIGRDKDGKEILIVDGGANSPPPESILDDVGETQTPSGKTPAPAGQSSLSSYYQISDHIPVKADYDGTPANTATQCQPETSGNTPDRRETPNSAAKVQQPAPVKERPRPASR